MRYFLTAISVNIVTISQLLFAQEPDIQWTNTYDSGELDMGFSVKQTTDGGYIITGRTESNGNNDQDVWLIKTDTNGDTLWTKIIGDSLDDSAGHSVQQTSDGGYIVVGNKVIGSNPQRHSDVWLIKTNASGDTLWTKTYNNSLSDLGKSVQQTNDNGYIITGYTIGHNGLDVLLIKTNTDGDTLWTKTFGDSLYDSGNSVKQTSDGGYIITGITNGHNANNYGMVAGDPWLIKTDANGDTLWTKTYLDSLTAWGNSIQQTTDGGFIITGARTRVENQSGLIIFFNAILLIKTDVYGDTLWTKTYGGSGNSVQQTIDGGYIVFGSSLIKTDMNGDTLWSKAISGNEVHQTSDGGYIVIGSIGASTWDVLLIKVAPDISSIDANPQTIIGDYQLLQNYPNPFNPTTIIEFSLPQSGFVTLKIYNVLGEELATLVSENLNIGNYRYEWDAKDFASGVYLYRLVAGDYVQLRKMILLR
jgi:hypothetical protein